MAKFEKKEITKKSADISRWYTDVILKAKLADYAPVRGSMVIRPYGYAIWEGVQEQLGERIKEDLQTPNAYFPLFVPMSLLKKEKEHVEGFSPELAVVTHGGGKELEEPLAVRPTSETIMYTMFAKWIQSWRDLPFKVNQWSNVVRWEMRTYLFLRTLEFLWQEGHTAHATWEEADQMARDALEVYRDFVESVLAIPVIIGKKPDWDKFPGADTTYALEALMPDGKALQMGTSHHLGDNFAKAYEVQFQDQDGELKHVFQTSWGMTTRVVGGLVLTHGDDQGLILPPKIAPIQVVVIPIGTENNQRSSFTAEAVDELRALGLRVEVDERNYHSVGYKFNEWELKGVPLRIELGENEFQQGKLTVVRRDTQKKVTVPRNNLAEIKVLLDAVQQELFGRAQTFVRDNTYEVEDYTEFEQVMNSRRGFLKAYSCGHKECEEQVKAETKATIRAIPLEQTGLATASECVKCRHKAQYWAYFAQAY